MSHSDSNQEKPQIDFARYRTPELYDAIESLVNVPFQVARIACFAFLGGVALAVAGSILLAMRGGGVSLIILVPLFFYSFVVGMFAGTIFGIAENIRRGMGNMLRLVDLLLDITSTIARDMWEVAGGDRQMPSASQLVRQVYRHLFLPLMDKAVGNSFGIFSRPVAFLYHMTLGRLLRVVDKLIPVAEKASATEARENEELAEQVRKGLQAVADHELRIVRTLTWVRQKIVSIGGWLKLLVMLPCYVIFAIVTALVLAPVIAVWILVADTAGEEAAGEQAAMLVNWLGK